MFSSTDNLYFIDWARQGFTTHAHLYESYSAAVLQVAGPRKRMVYVAMAMDVATRCDLDMGAFWVKLWGQLYC